MMKKLLVTNNSALIEDGYDKIYTDSPFVVESCNNAKYLNELLDSEFHNKIVDIRKKGVEINRKIIDEFFSNYKNDNVSLFDINQKYTNIFINVYKLLRLIDCYPEHKISIAVSVDELYDYDSSNIIDRFVNVYYWIAKISNLQNIKLICKNLKRDDLHQDHIPINSWFLRLIDLDKSVLSLGLRKFFKVHKKKDQKVYIYKSSNVIREIEPYLYDLGFSYENMPTIPSTIKKIPNNYDEKKIHNIIDNLFDKNLLEDIFKFAMYAIYKKIVKLYLSREEALDEYIENLNKNINTIVTNTIFDFDRLILKKKLQDRGFKIIVVLHGLTENYRTKSDFYGFKYSDIDMLLCFNQSEKKNFEEIDSKVLVRPISSVQEAKKPRFNKLKRFFINKRLKIKNKINVFYVSLSWPLNNQTKYKVRSFDEKIYNFDKKMINLLSSINKRVIYKNYPRRNYIDTNPINDYAKKFDNVKVIEGSYDFRYINTLGDIFIMSNVGQASTITWMINLGKPIIYLHRGESDFLNTEALDLVKKFFIFIDTDNHGWETDLKNILNKPYSELKKIWANKQLYIDKHEEEWLTGKNLHAGKLGAKYIKEFILQNTQK